MQRRRRNPAQNPSRPLSSRFTPQRASLTPQKSPPPPSPHPPSRRKVGATEGDEKAPNKASSSSGSKVELMWQQEKKPFREIGDGLTCGRVQLHPDPDSSCEICPAHEGDDAGGVAGADLHALARRQPGRERQRGVRRRGQGLGHDGRGKRIGV